MCNFCESVFESVKDLKGHINRHCDVCGKLFLTTNALRFHKRVHCTVYCKDCERDIKKSVYSYHIRTDEHRNKVASITLDKNLSKRESSFQERLEVYTYVNEDKTMLFPEEFFMRAEDIIINLLENALTKHITFKFNMELVCEYTKMAFKDTAEDGENDNAEEYVNTTFSHITKMRIVTKSDDIPEIYKEEYEDICTKMSEFQERDSGWSLMRIKYVDININQITIIRGCGYIPLPTEISRRTGACLNINNTDDYCFKWCIIASFFDTKELNNLQKKIPSPIKLIILNPMLSECLGEI